VTLDCFFQSSRRTLTGAALLLGLALNVPASPDAVNLHSASSSVLPESALFLMLGAGLIGISTLGRILQRRRIQKNAGAVSVRLQDLKDASTDSSASAGFASSKVVSDPYSPA